MNDTTRELSNNIKNALSVIEQFITLHDMNGGRWDDPLRVEAVSIYNKIDEASRDFRRFEEKITEPDPCEDFDNWAEGLNEAREMWPERPIEL